MCLCLTFNAILRKSLITELGKLQESNDQSLALCQQLAWLSKEEEVPKILKSVVDFRKFNDPKVLSSTGTI